MTALWIHEVADHFWRETGEMPTVAPRNLRDSVQYALPIATFEVRALSIAAINGWLAARRMGVYLKATDRPLRAAIIVHESNGILFVDPSDPADEQRFSLAHEISHYLIEYHLPRQRAERRLGPAIVPVLDGKRASTPDERIGALLGGVTLRASLHLMERTVDGHLPGREVSTAERQADALAYELLAPVDEIRAHLPDGADAGQITDLLRLRFGMPRSAAGEYARQLAPPPPAGSLFRQLFTPA